MKNLETLIQELCPDGVEFVKLGEVFDLFSGMSKVSNKWAETGNCKFIDYLNIYNNIIVDVNKLQNATVASFKQNVLKKGDILFTCASETPRECAISAVIRDSIADNTYLDDHLNGIRVKSEFIDKVNPVFVNYYFYSPRFRVAICKIVRGVTRFYIVNKNFLKIEIPLPPLEVQTEIVRILDKFTSLEAELEAELDCRKRQYEYYRDKLLSFENLGGQEITIGKIGDLGKICMCKRIMKNQTNSEEGIPFYKIGTFGKEADSYISEDIYNEYKHLYSYPKKGDVLLSAAGTIGRTVVFDGEPSYFQDSNIVWVDNDETKVLNTYLNYYYQIIEWKTQGGTIKRLYNNLLAGATIKYPSIAEQQRIVSILDRFESLTTSLQSGLPAEIAARRQQYEYYRDKLLTFKRKAS